MKAQSYSLTVNNGYGSGNYSAGDTVQIWCRELGTSEVFTKWTGLNLIDSTEWNTIIVMPPQNSSVTANFQTLNYTLTNEQIQGVDTLKHVISYFPNNNPKGVIYLFHGTGGSASGWITFTENLQFVKDAIADTFALIITESEETTYNTDFNGDGAIRWKIYPYTIAGNVDIRNINAITDTFINRNVMNATTPKYAVGMSDGSFFGTVVASTLNFQAMVSYCGQGITSLYATTTVPNRWCMAMRDDNSNVGQPGNAQALTNSNTLTNRNICSTYSIHPQTPLYPQRFQRVLFVNSTQSQNLFTELLNKGFINSANYLNINGDSIFILYQLNPSSFPILNSFGFYQKTDIQNELNASFSQHQFYSDYDKTTLNFLNNLCSVTTGIETINKTVIEIYPNPADAWITFSITKNNTSQNLYIYTIFGLLVYQSALQKNIDENKINISTLKNGMYLYKITDGVNVTNGKFVIER